MPLLDLAAAAPLWEKQRKSTLNALQSLLGGAYQSPGTAQEDLSQLMNVLGYPPAPSQAVEGSMPVPGYLVASHLDLPEKMLTIGLLESESAGDMLKLLRDVVKAGKKYPGAIETVKGSMPMGYNVKGGPPMRDMLKAAGGQPTPGGLALKMEDLTKLVEDPQEFKKVLGVLREQYPRDPKAVKRAAKALEQRGEETVFGGWEGTRDIRDIIKQIDRDMEWQQRTYGSSPPSARQRLPGESYGPMPGQRRQTPAERRDIVDLVNETWDNPDPTDARLRELAKEAMQLQETQGLNPAEAYERFIIPRGGTHEQYPGRYSISDRAHDLLAPHVGGEQAATPATAAAPPAARQLAPRLEWYDTPYPISPEQAANPRFREAVERLNTEMLTGSRYPRDAYNEIMDILREGNRSTVIGPSPMTLGLREHMNPEAWEALVNYIERTLNRRIRE